MVVIITGTIGIGKTTVCKKVIEIARSRGYSCGGIVTYKTRNEDIIIEDIQTGEIRDLASTHNIYQGLRTAMYFFNPEGIDFGIRAIEKGVTSDVLVVDELGQLELSGQGFVKVIDQIAAGKIKNCILVIRKSLLSSFIPKLGITTSVFEITINNRNHLPNEISMVAFGNHP
ncbi:MAG TPA: nucleoside-triphosphatase [Dehalococcoidales bacterium]